MNTKMILSTAVAALAFTTAAGPATANDNAARWQPRTTIEGSWEAAIKPVNCETGEWFAPAVFHSYMTFGSGGTLIETTSGRNFQPDQRSPGHGYWEYTGRRTYRGYFQAYIRFDSVDPLPPARPYVGGVQSFDQSIQMQDRNHWTSDALVTFRNASGEIVPPSGCATVAAERMP